MREASFPPARLPAPEPVSLRVPNHSPLSLALRGLGTFLPAGSLRDGSAGGRRTSIERDSVHRCAHVPDPVLCPFV